jgi:hypothetical protein
MTKMEILKKIIKKREVEKYLEAPYGYKFGVYFRDGKYYVAVGQHIGKEIAVHERPIIVIDCPGNANIPSTKANTEDVQGLRQQLLEAWEEEERWKKEYELHLQ